MRWVLQPANHQIGLYSAIYRSLRKQLIDKLHLIYVFILGGSSFNNCRIAYNLVSSAELRLFRTVDHTQGGLDSILIEIDSQLQELSIVLTTMRTGWLMHEDVHCRVSIKQFC